MAMSNYIKLFFLEGLPVGRILSRYKHVHNNCESIIFNACVWCEGNEIWSGDLDLKVDAVKLQRLAEIINKPLMVCYENKRICIWQTK